MEKASSRLRTLALLLALMFVALSTRLWFLQVLAAEDFGKRARENSVRFVHTEPLRGLVYDASGDLLVENQASLQVLVNRDAMGEQAEAVVMRLAELLDVEISVLREALSDDRYYSFQSIPVAQFVEEEVAYYISERPEQFPGVEVVATSVRGYPQGRLAAHVLGTVGLIPAEDYESLKDEGYGQNDILGRSGIERVYESFLRGEKGVQKFIVNADGEIIRALAAIPPKPGADLHLTIEADIQRVAERALREGMLKARTMKDSEGNPLKANSGAVVVLDVATGGVRAIASLPSYDPRWYVKGLSEEQQAYLDNANISPTLNRATALSYVPGSTLKPFTGLAAVKEGIATLSNSYPCTSEYQHPGDESGTTFDNWEPSNTYMTISRALQVSCDTVFYAFGSEFYNRFVANQLSDEGQLLPRDLREWGFGQPTGIDLPFEDAGLVPDVAWAKQHPDQFEFGWVPGIDILTMIGASWIEVTPLQLAASYAALGNGGHLCRPHLVDTIATPGGREVAGPDDLCERTLPYSPQQLRIIVDALATVTTGGTAACPFNGFPLSTVPVAGKTGTAERRGFQDTSWFAALTPADAPEYAIVVMVEQGGFGSQTAAPIARDIIESIYGYEEAPRPGCFEEQD
jgi:penicillin-binding protein 2